MRTTNGRPYRMIMSYTDISIYKIKSRFLDLFAPLECRSRQWTKGEHGYFTGSISTGSSGGGSSGSGGSSGGAVNGRSDSPKNNKNSSEPIDSHDENDIIESEDIVPATQQDINNFKNALQGLGFEEITGFENFTESNEHLLEIVEDFCILRQDFPDYFNGLKLDLGIIEGMDKDSYAAYDPRTGIIHLNPEYYNNFSKLIQSYASDVRGNYHPAGTNYRANVFHEFGHRFEHIDNINPKKQVKIQFEKTFNRYYTRKQADEWINKGLSLYAAEGHYGEFIAECFAEYYGSNTPRNISVDFLNSLKG